MKTSNGYDPSVLYARIAQLEAELAEARNAILREGLMVEELKEQLADCKAKLRKLEEETTTTSFVRSA